MISRLRKPLAKLPTMKSLRFLPSSLTGSTSDEEKQEAKVMKSMSNMDAEKMITDCYRTAPGEKEICRSCH